MTSWMVGRSALLSAIAAAWLAAGDARPAWAQRRETVIATGSSTVFPFTSAVADAVSRATGFNRAEVNGKGTVFGFGEFCQGAPLRYPDIQSASRRMTMAEFAHCGSRGVHEIIEIPIGYDGIVVAHRAGLPSPNLTTAQLWLGVAKEVPRDGRMMPNPFTSWRQVSPDLPDWPIAVIGPPPTSGTRDSFTDLALAKGCQGFPEVRTISDAAQRRRLCAAVREDGRWVDGGEDDEAIVRRVVEGPPGTLGVFGFSFLENNRGRIEGLPIDGVDDSRETIASRRYPLARPLFVYVKRPNLDLVPGLREMVEEYVSDRAVGPEGYLVRRGLVPLAPDRLREVREKVRNSTIMTGRLDR